MKLNTIKKIVVEDYDAASQPLMKKLALTLNPFLDQATTALNGQITQADNLKMRIHRLVLESGVTTKTLAWDVNEKPVSVTIGSLTLAGGAAPAAVFSLSWRYDDKGIHLTFLGLAAAQHLVTIIAQV